MSEQRLTVSDLIRLLAETDNQLAYWRKQDMHPSRQKNIDAYLARRFSLQRMLTRRTGKTPAVA